MKNLFSDRLLNKIRSNPIIAVLVIDNEEDAEPLAESLLKGGINVMELTLRTPCALGALQRIKRNVTEMTCGVGTVITELQVDQAVDAGAEFGVAPGTNTAIIKKALNVGFPFAPGIATPSDIEAAISCGCRLLKFFPAETSGGIDYLKSMTAPYRHLGLQFIPLGGLSDDNMKNYLECKDVVAIGGSWLANRELIREHKWAQITNNAKQALAILESNF